MKKIKRIAIIALDNKKTELIEWSYFNRKLLMPHKIFALAYAAKVLEGTLNKNVEVSEAGKFGEYRELCNLIINKEVDAVIIFCEAEEIFGNKDLRNILQAAIEHNIVIATNRTTADFVLTSSLIDDEYTIHKDGKKTDDKKSSVMDSYLLAKAS
jgi:methylglyoxal synthase